MQHAQTQTHAQPILQHLKPTIELPFITLLLMISFASVNAVLFTPALPAIADFFKISDEVAQYTITWFLIGYALSQLVYGPLANRFGRKPALYVGVGIQIMSSLLCVLAGEWQQYSLLVFGRFLLALGSGVGLKMTFTLINECYDASRASQKMSYLILAFAITPGIGVAVGGMLTQYFGWISCFYAGAAYGIILLALLTQLPETQTTRDMNALKIKSLIHSYASQFKNKQLMAGGLLMGGCSSFVYVFSAVAPFIAMNLLEMTSTEYGFANLLPPIGIMVGSLYSAKLAKKQVPLRWIMQLGIAAVCMGAALMIAAIMLQLPALLSLFLPMIMINFGLAFIMANASVIAMSKTNDKSHGSAVMNFTNMGIATVIVLGLSLFPVTMLILPMIYILLCAAMITTFKLGFGNR